MKLLLSSVLVLFLAQSALAADTVGQCVKKVTNEKIACNDNCKADFDIAQTSCKVPANECGEACKASYLLCVEPVRTNKENCVNSCAAGFDSGQVACETQCSCTVAQNCAGTTCFADCMDPVAIARAACRVSCWRNATFRNSIKSCNQTLRNCVKGCKKAPKNPEE